jgi:ribosomal protein L11 methyltransferase
MPYRVDIPDAGADAFDLLVELGALDADASLDGTVAAVMPDSVTPDAIARALGTGNLQISPHTGLDAASVWVLRRRPARIGRLQIVPADVAPEPGALRLVESTAFGTGLHPTTALCLAALDEALQMAVPPAVLDVGTGSGILALAALVLGVPRATALDIDGEALEAAAQNARLNELDDRLVLRRGGPETVTGTWPLVVANVLAAPLIEMAHALVQRVGHGGELLLSGIPASAEEDVDRSYRRLGMRRLRVMSRAGWVALIMRATW